MAAPSDESVPLEYMASSTTRRAPNKLQGIGIGQFRKQGVAHQFHPNSAAGILHKQKAEQRMEDWLRGAPVNAPQENAKGKGKKKAKKAAKDKNNEATSTTTKDAGVEGSTGNLSTGPAVAIAQMGQGKTAVEHGKTQDHTQGDASVVAKAPTRKKVKIVTVDRHVKPTQGAWGQRAAEIAKKAALKATGPSYSTTPIIIGDTDGELSATVVPQPKLPTPEPIISRAAAAQPKAVFTQGVPTKTIRKSSTKLRASKKSQAPMWSDNDDDDQDEDDLNDSLFSSHPASPSTKTPRSRTTRNSNPRGKATRDQPTPQKKRQVRFAPAASPEEEEEEEEEEVVTSNKNHTKSSTQQQTSKPASQAQQHQQPYNPLNLPQANFHIPSKPAQTASDPAELADDEDSQILSAKKTQSAQKETIAAPTSNPGPKPASPATPSSTPAKKRTEEQTPPRRKGVAGPPLPKRARATAETANDDDDDEANDSAAPVSKKAKMSGEKAKATKKDPAVRKKKGVARKVK